MLDSLKRKLNDKSAVIGIVGLGYVGLPLAIRYAEVGYKVIGFDNDPSKPRHIAAGKTYIKHIPSEAVQRATRLGVEASIDFQQASTVDALIICVLTPLDKHRTPDLRFVL